MTGDAVSVANVQLLPSNRHSARRFKPIVVAHPTTAAHVADVNNAAAANAAMGRSRPTGTTQPRASYTR